MRAIPCTEGDPFVVESELIAPVRLASARLTSQLRPTSPILSEEAGQLTLRGVVGTVSLAPGVVLEIGPKTKPGDDWIHAVLDLLIGADRVDAAGERAAGLSPHRRGLLEVLAAIYAARLQNALRRDGPILLIERKQAERQFLKGKLRVTRWLRRSQWQPHRLPLTFDEFSADHDYSRVLALAATTLADACRSSETRGRLLECARSLRPGFETEASVSRSAVHRRLPPQWGIYEPAWSVAVAVLSQRSLLGRQGRHRGVSVAVEVWPLLERLLAVALSAASRLESTAGERLVASGKENKKLLHPVTTSAKERFAYPDGRLARGGNTVAVFDAKYKRRESDDWPRREDVYQVLTAAAVYDAKVAVLVYPEAFSPVWWRVEGFQGGPVNLAAAGFGLFSYRAGLGDDEAGRRVLDLLAGPPADSSAETLQISLPL